MTIGKRLKHTREDKDQTQEQTAQAIGVSRRQVIRYENDEQLMSIAVLAEFCKYYKVSADYILGLPANLERPR